VAFRSLERLIDHHQSLDDLSRAPQKLRQASKKGRGVPLVPGFRTHQARRGNGETEAKTAPKADGGSFCGMPRQKTWSELSAAADNWMRHPAGINAELPRCG
jgi:hypothetical protein